MPRLRIAHMPGNRYPDVLRVTVERRFRKELGDATADHIGEADLSDVAGISGNLGTTEQSAILIHYMAFYKKARVRKTRWHLRIMPRGETTSSMTHHKDAIFWCIADNQAIAQTISDNLTPEEIMSNKHLRWVYCHADLNQQKRGGYTIDGYVIPRKMLHYDVDPKDQVQDLTPAETTGSSGVDPAGVPYLDTIAAQSSSTAVYLNWGLKTADGSTTLTLGDYVLYATFWQEIELFEPMHHVQDFIQPYDPLP